jgi:hypothetical protein
VISCRRSPYDLGEDLRDDESGGRSRGGRRGGGCGGVCVLREESEVRDGLNGMQIYDPPEGGLLEVGIVGDHDRLRHAKFLQPLAMNLIAKNEDEIRKLGSNFAGLREHWQNGVRPCEQEMSSVLLDSGDLLQPGGTGKTFDWKKAIPVAAGMREGGVKLVVAGGLTAQNVAEAIEILKPWGVDVVSGVEARPGKKDPEKVWAFVRAVRDIDRKVG